MKRGALYVEIDKFAAAWLRELIAWGLIADGDVYEGSFEDLTPAECDRYVQVHLCAGIGVWSAALRGAGWTDDRPVWTASFPCQPFSAAGQGGGFADERHLWPTGHYLIDQCRPGTVFGEQVASKPGLDWFDLVHADLEGSGYAVGAHDLCAAGLGAPHIRQRLFFVAHHHHQRRHGRGLGAGTAGWGGVADGGAVVDAAGQQTGLPRRAREPGGPGDELADTMPAGRPEGWSLAGGGSPASSSTGELGFPATGGRQRLRAAAAAHSEPRPPGQAWSGVDWIPCRDGKWRPVESGTFPLAHGATARVGRLRGYGNAIVLPVAQAFIEAAMTCL